jgi:hypothetical protein
MATGTPVDTFIKMTGHDGSEQINQLPDPLCRRGHHVQECVFAAMVLGYSATPFELLPRAASVVPGQPPRIVHYRGHDERFNWAIFTSIVRNCHGVVTGVGRNCHHAVAFDRGRILDPDGRSYSYSRDACEDRGFYTQAAWIVAPFSRPAALAFYDAESQGFDEWWKDNQARQAGVGTAEDGAAT